MFKCVCGYTTEWETNFDRHLRRKKNWCGDVKVTNNKVNRKQQMILFYYEMIREEKDFTIWLRNIRRVHKRFNRFYYNLINNKKDFTTWIGNISKVNQQFIDRRDKYDCLY